MAHSPEKTRNKWNTTTYDEDHSFVFEYGEGVVSLLEPETGERILDFGCGTGHLSHRIAATGTDVIGLDASGEMITEARETYPECDFVQEDARDLSFAEPFDAVFSNAALHWIPEQDAVLDSIADELRPNGRFVAELGGTGNVAAIVETVQDVAAERGYDVENPWYFPTVGEYTTRLEAHGFKVRYATLFDRPTELDGGPDELASWLGVFGDSLLSTIPDEEQQGIVSGVGSSGMGHGSRTIGGSASSLCTWLIDLSYAMRPAISTFACILEPTTVSKVPTDCAQWKSSEKVTSRSSPTTSRHSVWLTE